MYTFYQELKKSDHRLSWLFDYSREAWPMIVYIVFYFVCFRLLESAHRISYHVIHTPVDDMIPFAEIFVVPYLVWFPYMFLLVTYLYICDRKSYYRTARILCAGMTLMLVISLLFPNIQNLRPAVMPRDNIFTRMILRLYAADTPTNIFPSIHVFNTLAVIFGLSGSRTALGRSWTGKVMYVTVGVLIILSTMLIKQHSLWDVAFAFVFYYICRRLEAVRLPQRLGGKKRERGLLH